MRRLDFPTALLCLATLGLAFGPRFVLSRAFPDTVSPWWEPLQHLMLFLALLGNALLHGRNRQLIPWPSLLVALYLVGFALYPSPEGSALASRGVGHALAAGIVLALPWLCVVPRFRAGSAGVYALVFCSVAAFSALLGLVLARFTDWWAYSMWGETLYRFQGATRGDYFAGLAFGGVVIGLHEWNRRRNRSVGALATLSGILLILSGSRTAIIVAGAWVLCYVCLSPRFRENLSRLRSRLWFAVGGVAVAFLLYLPVLRWRMAGLRTGELNLSGREEIWADYFALFLSRPWLGLGLGATQPGILNSVLPHNEYLRLLVELGLLGTLAYLVGAVIWGRRVHTELSTEDRPYLIASMGALALYSLTDNPISSCYILPFIYLGVLLSGQPRPETRPSEASSQ